MVSKTVACCKKKRSHRTEIFQLDKGERTKEETCEKRAFDNK